MTGRILHSLRFRCDTRKVLRLPWGVVGSLFSAPCHSTVIPFLVFAVAASSLTLSRAQAEDSELRWAKVVPVELQAGTIERRFYGRVAARQTVDLAFQVTGQIIEFPVTEGSRLRTGELIARLDPGPFELDLEEARIEQERVERNYARYRELQATAVSRVEVEDAETQARLAAVRVGRVERALRQSTLNAPFEALVAQRYTTNFTTIASGTPVVRLHDMSELRIEIEVPEILIQKAGQDSEYELTARFPSIDAVFPLEIREFNAETSEIGQTFQITLGLTPPAGQLILPGSSVEVNVRIRTREDSLSIPLSAIVAANDSTPHVMVFEADGNETGIVSRVPVVIEPTSAGGVQVISGLVSGQEIIASGGALLGEGERVRRFSGFDE